MCIEYEDVAAETSAAWEGEIICAYQGRVRHIKIQDPVNANPTLPEQLIQLLRLTHAKKMATHLMLRLL
jgi:hypothetical protein